MAKYRKISPKIWNDAKFRAMSDNAKLVFFMLLTHPQTSAIGTMRAFPQGLAPEMGWTEKVFREAFHEVIEKGMCICAEKDGLIWLPNFMRYNPPESPNVLKSWAGALEDCTECSLKIEIFQHVKDLAKGFGKGFSEAFNEAFGEGEPQPLPNQEQKQEQENEDSLRSSSCPEHHSVDSGPVPGPIEAVITLPLNTGEEHPVTQGEIDQWQDLYPSVDVPQALRSMKGWLLANRQKRKTKTGISRFVQAWLAREQDRGGVNCAPRAAPAGNAKQESQADRAARLTYEAGMSVLAEMEQRGPQGRRALNAR